MPNPYARNRAIPAAALASLALISCATTYGPERGTVTGDRGSDMAVDLVVARPLGLVATAIGAAGFVIALPFTLPSGSAGGTACEWIAAPFDYTFRRPLGDFHQDGLHRARCLSGVAAPRN